MVWLMKFTRTKKEKETMPKNIEWYGWKRDSLDARDLRYSAPAKIVSALPPKVDLTPQLPAVFDQGSLGSCTSNAISSAFEFVQMKQDITKTFTPSRLFIYFNEREMEGTITSDAGAEIRDGIKSIAQQGVCPETQWPYNIGQFAQRPPLPCYTEASGHQALEYRRVDQTLDQMRGCLAEGFPFVFGFAVYESFESPSVSNTGIMPMPKQGETMVGGHAITCCGFDDSTRQFIIRNSWGDDWGIKGNFLMPYDFIVNGNYAADFWTIRLVENNDESPVPDPVPPTPNRLCDNAPWLLPALTAFVDGAVQSPVSTDEMVRGGFRGLQSHLRALGKLQAQRK